jgi:hypothetical protein
VSNILTAQVKIKGVRPLIWHAFGADSIPLEKQEREGVAGNSPQEWRKTVLVTSEGQLFLKPTYAFGCLREGARYTKKGRGSIQSLVAATLQVMTDPILIDRWFPDFPNGHNFDVNTVPVPPTDSSQPVFLDICGVRNPANKARNVRYRVAASTGWSTEFMIAWDKTVVDRNQMQSVCNDAGLFCGLGDGRSVGYGRFEITSFNVVE